MAVDYSGRDAILAAARSAAELSREAIGEALGPAVDLMIRTGGEHRLSDFLLWESAYAELVFCRALWPDFGAADLAAAVREFRGRDRRFGAVPPQPRHLREAWLE
jgi:undecaprenyl diphosphate synthase